MRWNAAKRERMLASEAATATRRSSVARCWASSIWGHYRWNRIRTIPEPSEGAALPGMSHFAAGNYNESSAMLTKVAEANFPSRFGHFRIYGFEGLYGGEIEECVVLSMGDVADGEPPLVRIHSQC